MREYLQETRAQFRRWMIRLKREPFNLTFALIQPLIWMLFFGGAFQKVASAQVTGGDYRTYILAGVIALTVFGGSMSGGIPLLFDRENGFLTRLLASPVSRSSILVSRFLATNLITTLQVIIMLGVSVLLGARLATGWAGAGVLVGICLLLGFGLTVLSLILVFSVRGHGDFFALLGTVTLHLAFLSPAWVPLSAMPLWMRIPARFNPMTYAIDAMRALILRGWEPALLLKMALYLVLCDAVLAAVGVKALRRRLS